VTAPPAKRAAPQGDTQLRHKGVVDSALRRVVYDGREMTRADALMERLWKDALEGTSRRHRQDAMKLLVPLLVPDASKLVDLEKVAAAGGLTGGGTRVVRFVRDETRAKPPTRGPGATPTHEPEPDDDEDAP
jgi:hypothetical protein